MALIVPKIDCMLHDHLDGSWALCKIVGQLYQMNSRPLPSDMTAEEFLRHKFLDVHANIVEAFDHVISLLRIYDAIVLAVNNHVETRASQGIKYDEFMIAPQYHTKGGLSLKRVIEAAVAGIKLAESNYPNIEANLLVGIGRELPPAEAIKVLKAVEQSDSNYVVGVNLVCDESEYPPELHRSTFEYALAAGIKFEIHAAEWVRKPEQAPDFERDLPLLIKNLRVAMVELRANRIGHGIALPYDEDLIEFAVRHNVGITGCPGSNISGRSIPNLETLKIREMLEYGVLWSMNPDDDFFHPSIEKVFWDCHKAYRFTIKEVAQMRRNAWLTRFGSRKPVPSDL